MTTNRNEPQTALPESGSFDLRLFDPKRIRLFRAAGDLAPGDGIGGGD